MSTTHRTVAALGLNIVSLLTACLLVAGCAAGGGAGPAPTGSAAPVGPTVTTAAPTAAPATSSGGQTSVDAGTMVLRGTMIESVEVGCHILEADYSKDTYQLMGLPDDLARPGTRVEVRGQVAQDLVSFCMQGTIFQVSSARRI
jgi:hypothetical protein